MSILLFSEKANDQNKDKIKVLFRFSLMDKEKFKPSDGKLSGIAVPYNEETQDWRKVSFAPNSFKNLKKVPSFVNHDSYDVLSMIGASEFKDSKNALNFIMSLNLKDPDVINKIIPLIEMGALEGVSIGAFILKKEDSYDEDGERIGTVITEAEIYELSVVTFQAFEKAKIKAEQINKSKETTMKTKEELKAEEDAKAKLALEKIELEKAEAEKLSKEDKTNDDEKTDIELKKVQDELKKKDDEIAELKFAKTEKEKKDAINDFIQSGIVHKAQFERIMKSFDSAESIKAFYKDIPASFSVESKGVDSADVTTDDIKTELYASISNETSSLSKEDFEKYSE